jgi:hypothetical protein
MVKARVVSPEERECLMQTASRHLIFAERVVYVTEQCQAHGFIADVTQFPAQLQPPQENFHRVVMTS